MKTVLANTIGSISKRKGCPNGRDAFSLCGGNTGNVCFVDAVKEQLASDEEISCYEIASYKEKAVFVLPASNWINLDGHVLRDIFLSLEDKDVQLAVLGIGVQFERDGKIVDFVTQLSKDKDTIKALKILSEHSKYIGIRGSITGECLDRIGIHNWKVIGCPSFYEQYRLYGQLRLRKYSVDNSMVISVTPGKYGEHKILEYGMRNRINIILQSMNDMPLILWENRPVENRHLSQKFPGLEGVSATEVEEYIRKFGHMFYTREKWSEYLKENDVGFAFGSRFHGNMMAFLNGIPALWIKHDMRTCELIDAMKLPYITYDDLGNGSMDEIANKCVYDKQFEDNYMFMGQSYISLLEDCNVNHTFDGRVLDN